MTQFLNFLFLHSLDNIVRFTFGFCVNSANSASKKYFVYLSVSVSLWQKTEEDYLPLRLKTAVFRLAYTRENSSDPPLWAWRNLEIVTS